MTQTEQPATFAQHVADYALAGWPCILPVPSHDKHPPPVGFTGAEGRDTTPEQLVAWAGSHAAHSIAIRMPDGVVGIDVDSYEKRGTQKHGAETLASCVERWGQLPPTWSSTARGGADGPGDSRIMFFRAPAQRYATRLTGQRAGGAPTSDVEVIQRHHRYAVVWPSPHPGAGPDAIYRWYEPTGALAERVPSPHELAELPQAWVEGLLSGAASSSPVASDAASGQALLDQLLDDWRTECADITSVRQIALDELGRAEAGSRHDAMTARVYQLLQMASAGHAGVAAALLELRTLWDTLTSGEDRSDEFDRMLLTGARKAVTERGPVQVANDPCFFKGTVLQVQAAAPGDDRPADPERPELAALEGVEAGHQWSIRSYIGVEAFDPLAQLDQSLAHDVLQRTVPAVRYAFDARTWLLRLNDRWETRRDLAPWLVAEVAWLMPLGDPTAEKGSDQHTRATVRQRLMTNAGAKAVAGKIDALVAAGTYPGTLALGDLDADPEILWAGGLPWSLRFSDVEPVVAEHVDPNTPHMHSCGVAPAAVPTPMWDAFLAAVWPDPEHRAWALRVLSIAFTGYADRALPVLLGETGRGKTQVVDLLMSVLGSYAHAANPKLLTNTGAHDTIRYSLKGRRLSFIDEAPAENRAGQEHLKQLTGGGEITANQMHKDPITFRPTHTLVLTANDEPLLTDPAVRSRVRLIPCEGDPEQVRAARAAIGSVRSAGWRAEAPGVLASMLREAAGWLSEPSTGSMEAAPEHLMYLAERLGAEQDPITVWLTEETEPYAPGTPSRELYQAFRASCQRSGHRSDLIPTETRWARELERRGHKAMKTRHGNRRPLRLRTGGFQPGPAGFEPSTDEAAPEAAPQAAPRDESAAGGGFAPQGGGLVEGFTPNPPPTFSQVNPDVSVAGGGCGGFEPTLTRTHAPAPAQEPLTENTLQPSTPAVTATSAKRCRECGGTTGANGVHDDGCATGASAAAKAKAARTQRATAAAEKRAAAVAEAGGPLLELPAVLLADGTVTSCSAADAAALLAGMAEVTVDVETTGFPPGHRDYALRTVQLGDERFAVVLDPAADDQADVVRAVLAAAQVLHAHSATADLVPLALADLVDHEAAWDRMHDTVVPAKLADPASTGSDPSLKKLAEAMLGPAAHSPAADEARSRLFKAGGWLTETKADTPVERSGWAQVDSRCETMVRYAASDVLDDAALARRLPQPEPRVLERERLAQRMTARVARRGLALDAEQVERLYAGQLEARAEADRRLRALGVEKPTDAHVAAAAERFGLTLPRTNTGRPSVAAGVLEPYAKAEGELGELIRARLDYQEAKNRIGLFLEGWRQAVVNGDGRVRPTVYTMEAKTGRMSCVRPNLQQVPRSGGFRSCITADPGHVLISADFASVELRVAAALSQDRALMAIMADPERDVHHEVARIAFGPSAGKPERYLAKPMVFGRLYGSGASGMARQNGVSEATARSVIDALDTLTPELSAWSRSVASGIEAGRTKFATHAGRVIHLPTDRPYAGANYAIQGTARELLIDALERWSATRWGRSVLLPVHDELVVHVPEDDAHEATAALVEAMTTELYGVPIVAEADEPSFRWEDAA